MRPGLEEVAFMVDTKDTDHAQEVLKRKREALHALEKKVALYSPAEVPEHLVVQEKVLQEEIAKLEAQQKAPSRAKKRKREPKPPPDQVPESAGEPGSEEPTEVARSTWDKYRTQIIVAAIAALAVVLAAVCGLFPGAVTEITRHLLNRPTSVAVTSPTAEPTYSPVPVSTSTPTLSPVPGTPPPHVRPTDILTPTATSTFTPTLTPTPIPPTNTPTPTFTPTPLVITLLEPEDGKPLKWQVTLGWQFRELGSNECFSVRAWPYALGKENIREEDRCFHEQTPELQYNGGLGSCSGEVWWGVVYVPVSCDVARNYTGAITITSKPGWFFYEPPPPPTPTPTKPWPN